MQQQVLFRDLGRKAYKEVWDYQESLLKENTDIKSLARNGENQAPPAERNTVHHLLFVEHNPVYTLGKNGKEAHVLIGEQERIDRGIEYFHINRGGDITFHGPGQLVGYPILDLEKFRTDLGWYLRNLEETIILTIAEYGLKGERSAGETGVWLDPGTPGKERKICAMGIKCSRWITMHGFAFNINTDLGYFGHIVPCGIQNKQVTSLQHELGREISFEEVSEKVKRNFEKVFEAMLVQADSNYEIRSTKYEKDSAT
jgi:lipoyl(octanoyl) transferase